MTEIPSLPGLRQAIDAVDDQVLVLLNRRAALAAEVGRLKAAAAPDALFHAPAREREVLARLEAASAGPFPAPAVRTVFQEIMSACLSLEKPLRVAFLGPEGTFTHLAARHQFGGSGQALPQGTIQAVFQAVERRRADYGVVPVENATEGAVDSTLDAFLDSSLAICAEILLPVDQALLLRPDLDLGGVRRVYSHPQALGQCRRWLEAHLPGADRIEAPSTSEAARLAREDAEGAAVASELAADLFGLRVAETKIQDLAANATRFLVLGPTSAEPTGRDRTTLLAMAQDGPGALLRLLEPLARRGLNLSRIQSRPTRRKLWEYVFFLDVEGHAADPALAEALEELRGVCASLKVLGSYPRALEVAR
ncbi:prephenate dehydratase [Geothrix alkalitolerans]|uniref:prephenate dehydratase n=1 Tax=Geothrix alkalitolerans TaxID=2922724 RepID=UPI001FAF909B|nr:prephenate dehydratase [Geothrix alkalitolerans]